MDSVNYPSGSEKPDTSGKSNKKGAPADASPLSGVGMGSVGMGICEFSGTQRGMPRIHSMDIDLGLMVLGKKRRIALRARFYTDIRSGRGGEPGDERIWGVDSYSV